MKFRNIKVMSSAITLLVIMVLMLLAPASAIDLNISPTSSTSTTVGNPIEFDLEVESNTDERVPIEYYTIEIRNSSGGLVDSCQYDTSYSNISGACSNFEVTQQGPDNLIFSSTPGYGYGYAQSGNFVNISFLNGYGYGTSTTSNTFRVSWTPTETGTYSARFVMLANDGSNFVNYATQNDVSFTVSAASSSGGGGGSSSSDREVIRDDDEVTKIADELKVEKDNIRRVEVISKGADRTSSSNNETFESLDEDDKRVVEENSQNRKQSPKSIKRSTEVLRVSFDDFTSRTVTRIINEVEDSEDENLRIIEIIPKSMTNSVDDIEGNFEVLRDNPIIAFDSAQYEYYVNGDQTTQTDEITTLVFTGDEEVVLPGEKTTEPTIPEQGEDNTMQDSTTTPQQGEDETMQDPTTTPQQEGDTPMIEEKVSSSNTLIILVVVLLIAIIAAGFFFYTRKEN